MLNKRKLALILASTFVAGTVTLGASNLIKTIEGYRTISTELQDRINELESSIRDQAEKLEEKEGAIEELLQEKESLTNAFNELEKKYKQEIAPVCFNKDYLLSPSNATERKLKLALEGTGLSGLESSYITAEEEYGVNAIFLVSLTAEESGWGNSRRARLQNNMSGFEVYTDSSKGATFSSKHESIMQTAKLLKNHYLTEGGQHFNGYSIYDVNLKYSASLYSWSENISEIAYSIMDKINSQL